MLASLLPGLREVRTPLTVGYLWLLFIWLGFADKLPTERPAGDNLIARWFDLSGMLGQPATIAALSFLAYVIGAIFTVPTEGPRLGNKLRRLRLRSARRTPTLADTLALMDTLEDQVRAGSPAGNLSTSPARRLDPYRYLRRSDFSDTEDFFRMFLFEEIGKVSRAFGARETSGGDRAYFAADDEYVVAWKNGRLTNVEGAFNTPLAELRSPLLVANQEVYGEYDRLAAEADFRVNLAPPTIFLGIPVAIQLGILWGVGLVLVAGVLFIQGTTRLLLADAVLMRAVLDRIIEHPVTTKATEAIDSLGRMLSGREARAG